MKISICMTKEYKNKVRKQLGITKMVALGLPLLISCSNVSAKGNDEVIQAFQRTVTNQVQMYQQPVRNQEFKDIFYSSTYQGMLDTGKIFFTGWCDLTSKIPSCIPEFGSLLVSYGVEITDAAITDFLVQVYHVARPIAKGIAHVYLATINEPHVNKVVEHVVGSAVECFEIK